MRHTQRSFITYLYGHAVESTAEGSKQGVHAQMRLGSLAVKRVLGKDESPGSNPGLGFFHLFKIVSDWVLLPSSGRFQPTVSDFRFAVDPYRNPGDRFLQRKADRVTHHHENRRLSNDPEALALFICSSYTFDTIRKSSELTSGEHSSSSNGRFPGT